MEEVGVRAVVENTSKFLSDMRKINTSVDDFAQEIFDLGTSIGSSKLEKLGVGLLDVKGAIGGLGPAVMIFDAALKKLGNEIRQLGSDVKTVFVKAFDLAKWALQTFAKAVQTIFSPAKSIIDAFVGSLKRIGEIATGILIANTVRKLADTISGMATAAMDAAISFQTLEVRLKGLAARQIFNQGEVQDFGKALDMASGKASDLMDWVIDLSLKAPISTEAIANTLTMATSYGLAEDAAKDMTKAVLVFSSGMGLTDLAQRRIIENYGQMIQQGKITSMEMRDMARGAFVPVGDLLQRTADLLGMTADEFDGTAGSVNKFASENGLDSVMTFMQAFIDMTETEFSGAIERMGATIQGLRQRFKNLTGAIIGLNILKPSLDLLGGSISKIFDAIAESDKIQSVSKEIGNSLKLIVEDLLGEMPSVEIIVEKIETALVNVRDALNMFREGDTMGGLETLGVPQGLLNFLKKIKDFTTSDKVTNFISNIETAFNNLKVFWETHGETIKEALKVAAGEIFDSLGIEMPESAGEGFLAWTENLDIETVLQNITDIKDGILDFIMKLQELIVWIDQVIPKIIGLGYVYALIKRPLLTAIATIGGLIALYWVNLKKAWDAGMGIWWDENVTAWFDAGKDFIEQLWEGLKSFWDDKVLPWLGGIADTIRGVFTMDGGGGSSQTRSSTQSVIPFGNSTTNSVTNNNINLGPITQRSQAPARMRDDVAVLLSKIG